MDQISKIHGDGLLKHVLSRVDGLDVRAVQKYHARRPHVKSIIDSRDL